MGERRIVNGWIYERGADGSINPVGPADGGSMPTDPTFQYKGEGAALDNAGKRADIANDAQRLQLERERVALTRQTQARAEQAAQSAQAINSRERQAKVGNLNALAHQIARVRSLYAQGPGRTKGIAGAADFLPTPGNRAFDTAGASLGEIGLSAFRVPGVGSQSDAELKAFIQANRPSSSDYDDQINEKLRNLETRLTEAYKPYGVNYRGAAARADQRKRGLPAAPRKPKSSGSRVIDFNDLPE